MSNDNLLLFPKKSTSEIEMTRAEAKWMLSGSLLVILCVAIGVNSALFAQTSSQQNYAGQPEARSNRSIASINPIFKVSWEKRAFEVLEKTKQRDLANVGKKASPFDDLALGDLAGRYSIRQIDGKISEIQMSENSDQEAKVLGDRSKFLMKNLALFSDEAKNVKALSVHDNDERSIEKFQLIGAGGEGLGIVQVLLDKDQKLLSMTVQ